MSRLQRQAGSIPLHHQVYLDLCAALDEGEWKAGEQIPPERELADRYGCSLITVRRALTDLAREARIERFPGRGTFVRASRLAMDLATDVSFTELMRLHGMQATTELVEARVLPASEAIASALEKSRPADVIYLERLRLAEGEPLLLEQVHLSAEAFDGLLDRDLEGRSLYDILAEDFGTEVTHARETIEPVLLRSREAELLDQATSIPALLVQGVAVAGEKPVEYTRSYVRGDRARLSMEHTVQRRPAT